MTKLDRSINKWLSRKLLVFIITTVGLFLGNVLSGDFIIIAAVYIGSEAVIDAVHRLKQNG